MCGSNDRGSIRIGRAGDEHGVALITALALLVLFSMLGTAYLGYMLSEREATRLDVTWVHARQAAEAGVYSAIGRIEQQLATGFVSPEEFDLELPAYRADDTGLAPREDLRTVAAIAISDENARININAAPRGVLERILKVDRATARTITSDLPRPGDGGSTRYGWFTRVDDLVTRGYMSQDAYDALDTSILTVYTGDDMVSGTHSININAASAEVIAALLNIPLDRAQAIADGPPLTTLDALTAAADQDAPAFNLVPDPNSAPGAMPDELTLESRTFRIVSEARVAARGGEFKGSPESRVEAVVHFPTSGKVEIRYWSVGRASTDEPASPVAGAAPPAAAEDDSNEQSDAPAAAPAPVEPRPGADELGPAGATI